ncbi:formylglycine-generating enzyme family protein, partial [Sphingomonadaceae bacterium]|nr:formylglycine-generating enzyme family protein [Sphingomonadaceae bacterium]
IRCKRNYAGTAGIPALLVRPDLGTVKALMRIVQTLPAAALLSLAACASEPVEEAGASGAMPDEASGFAASSTCPKPDDAAVRVAGGTFIMGSGEVYAEEGPERRTTVDQFWIDPHEVTNGQFAKFIDATGYVTVAEKPVDPADFGVPEEQIPPYLLEPGSAVFTPPEQPSINYSDWWVYVPGANWERPYGPTGPKARDNDPAVHLAWEDMLAYAEWRGGRIPTEAEWEYAASAGAEKYTDQPDPETANSWQGIFPIVNEKTDGYIGLAPVGCFAPNDYGLYDMVGNVWEVTADLYAAGHDPGDTDNPQGPSPRDPSEVTAYDPRSLPLASRVMKGGSYLCASNYCQRYRPESRQGRDPGMGASNVGFRVAYDAAPKS